MRFGQGDWQTFEAGSGKEWLLTNGLGGYASATIIGANTRKYHGLLVAALHPPVDRTLLLAKLDERLEAGTTTYNLATNETKSGVSETGYLYLQRVSVDPFPTFVYAMGEIRIIKRIGLVYGANTAVITYHVYNGTRAAQMSLYPLVNCRNHHWTTSEGSLSFQIQGVPGGISLQGPNWAPPLYLVCSDGYFQLGDWWYRGMVYAGERERGEGYVEDHYMPGYFRIPLAPGEEKIFTVLASTGPVEERDGPAILAREEERLARVVEQAGFSDPFVRRLVQAADSFIVERRSTAAKSVIAGYPWFTDWGRDTMIALPGLTLVTRRFADARGMLLTFARYCRQGLIPNMFTDDGGEPFYNTVDASLWYFHAVHRYLAYSGDDDFVREEIFPVLQDIVSFHIHGTRFNIGVDDDGLLQAGSPGIQLTWMDAKADDWVVTPRHGKPVEINALWYNALRVLQELAVRYGEVFKYRNWLEKVEHRFLPAYWYAKGGYLYDVLGENGPDTRLRPNQLMAVSLPYTLLDTVHQRRVVAACWQNLYTIYGMRSLVPGNPDYHGQYRGNRYERDGAYHQGTAWSWLIGQFVTALRRAYNYTPASRLWAGQILDPFTDHLRDHGVGYISEIFDGDAPHRARGCPAQAWGVAEVLRAYVEEVLEIRPELAQIK